MGRTNRISSPRQTSTRRQPADRSRCATVTTMAHIEMNHRVARYGLPGVVAAQHPLRRSAFTAVSRAKDHS